MNKLCGVYKITNKVNDKVYIGSSIDIDTRIVRHKRELDKGTHNNNYLQNAWNKHGGDSFEFEIILICDEAERLDKEQHEIDKAWGKDGKKLYNIAKNTLAPMTGIESPMKGRTHTKETRIKMSRSHKGKPSPNKGKKASKETRLKMSRIRKGWNAGEKHPNAVYDKVLIAKIRTMYLTGKYTQAELAEMFLISKPHVTNIINNKAWYDKEYEKIKPKGPVRKPPSEETRDKLSAAMAGKKHTAETLKKMSLYNWNNKSVVQLDLKGQVIREYRSACEAARAVQTDNSAISRACRGEYKTSGGYRWMYYKDYINQNQEGEQLSFSFA